MELDKTDWTYNGTIPHLTYFISKKDKKSSFIKCSCGGKSFKKWRDEYWDCSRCSYAYSNEAWVKNNADFIKANDNKTSLCAPVILITEEQLVKLEG